MNRCSRCKKLLLNEYELRRHRCHQEDDILPVHNTLLDSLVTTSFAIPSYDSSPPDSGSNWDSGGGDSGGAGASGDW